MSDVVGPVLLADGHYQPYRIFLSRRMADAVSALDHPGTEVRGNAFRLWLRSDDPPAFLEAVRAYRGPRRGELQAVADKVRMAREGNAGMRGKLR